MKVTMILFALLLFVSSIASQYLGCFIDSSEQRVLPLLQIDESDEPAPLSVESCVLMCAADNWPFAGLQVDQCFCGREYQTLGNATESECRTRCAGDEETDDSKRQYCGGVNRNSVYATGAANDQADSLPDDVVDATPAGEPQRPVVNLDFPTGPSEGAAPIDVSEDDPVDPFETVTETKLDDYKTPKESGNKTPNTPVQAPTPKPPVQAPTPKPPVQAPTPKPTPPKPTPRPAYNAKCPICPYKHAECGGPTRGTCNRRTGACECVKGRYGGACQGINGNNGPDRYGTGNKGPIKCPVCPYKAVECGGPTRGDCNRQTGDCVCKAGWSGGACSGRNGKAGIAAYNPRPPPPPYKPQILCPVCPYKKQECGGPTRGNCNRQTGACQCINGWNGGACGGRNGKVGAAAYGIRPPSGQVPAPAKCPVCPYKKEECGGQTRGECNRQTAECVCKAPWSGGACSNRPGRPGAAGYHVGPRPAPRPTPNYQDVKCPVCPYRHAECGGPNRGDCNKQTGECVCKTGYSGGACSNHGGRIGAAAYQTGKSTTGGPNNNKCPICPYKKNECGGPERGRCDRATGDCKCINGWSGGACSGRNGKIGIAAYNRATLAEGASYSSTGSDNKVWITAVAILGSVVLVLFVAVIALVVKLNSKEEERM